MASSTIPGLADSSGVTSVYTFIANDGLGNDKEVTLAQLKAGVGGVLASFFVPAKAAYPAQTAGCGTHVARGGSAGQPTVWVLPFDATTKEHCEFAVQMPKNWDRGTVQAAAVWRHEATTTNFQVRFGCAAVAIGDDDAGAVNFGTAQEVTDTGGTTADLYFTAKVPAITIAGSPASEDMVFFDFYRDPAHAADTMAIDAELVGVKIYLSLTTTDET